MRILFILWIMASNALAGMSSAVDYTKIEGATDFTQIGNVSDALKVSAAQSGSWTNACTQSGTWTVQQGTPPWSASQSGTWTVQPGNTANTTAWYVKDDSIGPVSPGTQATKSSLAGGVYNSSAPTLTNTQQASLQLNASGALIVDDSMAPGVATINRQDVSGAKTSSSNSGTLDSSGLEQISATIDFSSFTGTTPTAQVHLQVSDDASSWVTIFDTPKESAATTYYFRAERLSHRYYRYSWDIAGTTPSVTIAITTTIKAVQTSRHSRRFFYSDIDLTVNGNASSVFEANDCKNVTVTFERGADGGNNGTVQLFGSIDQTNWFSVSGNLAANVSSSNDLSLSNQSFPYYEIQVMAHTSAGTRVLDIQWSCN